MIGLLLALASTPTLQDAPEEWRLSVDPSIVVGELGSDPAGELHRVLGYALAPDGSLVVLSAGHSQVKVYDREGVFLHAFGRPGPGPGEMTSPLSMTFVEPDTVFVVDRDGLETFRLDGTHLASRRLPSAPNTFAPGTSPHASRVLPDGTILGVMTDFGQTQPPGLYRPKQGFVIWPDIDEAPRLLGWFGGIEQEYLDIGGSRQVNVPPFARRTFFATRTQGTPVIAVADNERFRIEIYTTSGERERIIERPDEQAPIEPSWIESWKERRRASVEPSSALPRLEREWAEMTIPATLPPHEGVAIDETGLVWILEPGSPDAAPRRYEVIDTTGRSVASIEVPSGLIHGAGLPPWISEDRFVGLWQDDFGVESVRVYRLDRSGR